MGVRLLIPAGCTFPFVLRDNHVLFTTDFASASPDGTWLGVGGAVLDAYNQPLPGILVHVWRHKLDLYTISGTHELYLPDGGWEIQIDTMINTQAYLIQLETDEGTALSPTVMLTFPGDCDHNLAILVFRQILRF
jgi:hypothetical protein